MSTREPTDRPAGHGGQPHTDDEHTRRKTNWSPLSPSPSEYSVELSLPSAPWLDFHFRSPVNAPAASAQRVTGPDLSELAQGETLVALMPMSLGRSAKLIWRLVSPGNDVVLAVVAAGLIGVAWCVVLCWYLIWCVAVVPYRAIARPGTRGG
jgi:hypothetical protein